MHHRFLTARGAAGARLICLVAALFAVTSHPTWAAPATSDAELTKAECGACHFPFARDWLPAYSWKQIMDHLDDHFGDNAALDDATRARIESYLIGERSAAIPIRITEMDGWKGTHGGGTTIETFAQQKGFAVSNCEKCHR